MGTPTNSVDACSKKSKKPLIAGIVVAVVVLAGIGFWTWHNTPGFCGVCHTPMSTYVATYEAQPNAQATDKWGNDVTNSNAMLVVTHKEAGVECLSCHVPSITQQIGEVTETITGDYYYPLSEVSISALQREFRAERKRRSRLLPEKRLPCHRERHRDIHARGLDEGYCGQSIQPA